MNRWSEIPQGKSGTQQAAMPQHLFCFVADVIRADVVEVLSEMVRVALEQFSCSRGKGSRAARVASYRFCDGAYGWTMKRTGVLDRLLFLSYIDSMSTVDRLSDKSLDLLQGTLEVLILRSLKLQPNHAYGISQFLQEQSDSEFLVDNGSLYPALQRLLQREWISAQWKTSPNGRRARYYNLTPAGRKQLVKETSKWQRFALAMARILAPEG